MWQKGISDVAKKDIKRAFFLLGGLGCFKVIWIHYQISVVEICVLPVLMHECESCILPEGHLKLLEAFQGEMAKQILQLPKQFSNTAAVTALDWPSVRVGLLVRKLSCLKRVTDTLVGGVVRAFSDELPSEGM